MTSGNCCSTAPGSMSSTLPVLLRRNSKVRTGGNMDTSSPPILPHCRSSYLQEKRMETTKERATSRTNLFGCECTSSSKCTSIKTEKPAFFLGAEAAGLGATARTTTELTGKAKPTLVFKNTSPLRVARAAAAPLRLFRTALARTSHKKSASVAGATPVPQASTPAPGTAAAARCALSHDPACLQSAFVSSSRMRTIGICATPSPRRSMTTKSGNMSTRAAAALLPSCTLRSAPSGMNRSAAAWGACAADRRLPPWWKRACGRGVGFG
ncbi:hypothetical protein T492DRAFT_1056044 [Pavlovales sp. CCMP2436]|nr:hypothetical protein T492DRAFT_1056044 [Pavlovales sp. CCMP2436]